MRLIPALCLFGSVGLAACASTQGAGLALNGGQIREPGAVVASTPRDMTGEEHYQGHSGPARSVEAAPAMAETNDSAMPDFATGADRPVGRGTDPVYFPPGNAGDVESLNSLASPP